MAEEDETAVDRGFAAFVRTSYSVFRKARQTTPIRDWSGLAYMGENRLFSPAWRKLILPTLNCWI
jgi:hypothetical protein